MFKFKYLTESLFLSGNDKPFKTDIYLNPSRAFIKKMCAANKKLTGIYELNTDNLFIWENWKGPIHFQFYTKDVMAQNNHVYQKSKDLMCFYLSGPLKLSLEYTSAGERIWEYKSNAYTNFSPKIKKILEKADRFNIYGYVVELSGSSWRLERNQAQFRRAIDVMNNKFDFDFAISNSAIYNVNNGEVFDVRKVFNTKKRNIDDESYIIQSINNLKQFLSNP